MRMNKKEQSLSFNFLRPPARGRAPAQDTSRARPAARKTDTSHDSIQQIEQRLCFFRKMNSFAKEFVKNS